MTGINYSLLPALPTLGDLDSKAPLSWQQFCDVIAANSVASRLISFLPLADDLLEGFSCLSGGIPEVEMLSIKQEELSSLSFFSRIFGPDDNYPTVDDGSEKVLAELYRRIFTQSVKLGSQFVPSLVQYEVTLRNELAALRAKRSGVVVERCAEELEQGFTGDLAAVVTGWGTAPNPLQGLLFLQQARWNWISANDSWFRFSNDEVAAYGAKLLALLRRERLAADKRGEVFFAQAGENTLEVYQG